MFLCLLASSCPPRPDDGILTTRNALFATPNGLFYLNRDHGLVFRSSDGQNSQPQFPIPTLSDELLVGGGAYSSELNATIALTTSAGRLMSAESGAHTLKLTDHTGSLANEGGATNVSLVELLIPTGLVVTGNGRLFVFGIAAKDARWTPYEEVLIPAADSAEPLKFIQSDATAGPNPGLNVCAVSTAGDPIYAASPAHWKSTKIGGAGSTLPTGRAESVACTYDRIGKHLFAFAVFSGTAYMASMDENEAWSQFVKIPGYREGIVTSVSASGTYPEPKIHLALGHNGGIVEYYRTSEELLGGSFCPANKKSICSNICVSLDSAENCGHCGNRCSILAKCVNGQCSGP